MKIDPNMSLAGPTVTVVEMGGDWFKLARVARNKAGARVTHLALKRAEEIEGLRGAGLLQACGVSGGEGPVIACLPRQMVNVRLFDLPSGDPREIADMIDLQIARQTPYSREEIVYDYRVIDAERPGYTRVMLVIAQSSQVRQRVRLLEDAGFDVELVAVSTDGWLGALQAQAAGDGKGRVACLDLDSTHGDLLVLQDGLPLFSRSIAVGVRDLAEDRERQEERLVQELARALETFRNESPAGTVERLTVFGDAARLPGLTDRLQDGLRMPVAAGAVRVEEMPDHPALRMASVTGLLGIAVAGPRLQINLMPESVGMRKAVTAKARQMTSGAVLAMAALALFSLWVESRIQRREVYLAGLDEMIRKTKEPAEVLGGMRQKVELVAGRLERRMTPARVLAELHEVAGDRVAFTVLELAASGKVVCRGTADERSQVGMLVNAMEVSPLFRNAQEVRTDKGKERVEFEIACEVEDRKP